jgi:hypothetical protein
MITLRHQLRRAVAIGIAAAMLNLCTTVVFAYPKPDSALSTGMTTLSGVVTIDGLPALSGQTLFSGSSIVTAQRSESRLDLGNRARLKLYAQSKLTVEFSRTSLTGSLENGILHSFVPAGVRANIVTADALISTDPDQPGAFSIQVDSAGSTISVESGRVEVRTGNSLRLVTAGETFSTGYSASLLPGPQQNTNKRKWVWLFLGMGAAVAVLVVAITGRDHEDESGCVAVPTISPTGGPGMCQ